MHIKSCSLIVACCFAFIVELSAVINERPIPLMEKALKPDENSECVSVPCVHWLAGLPVQTKVFRSVTYPKLRH